MEIEITKAKIKAERELLKQQKRKQHKKFYKANRSVFILLDILVVICILFNFSALVITNIMLSEDKYKVAKETGVPVVYYEVNTAQTKANDFRSLDDVAEDLGYNAAQLQQERLEIIQMWKTILRQSLLWAFLLFAYIINRVKIYNHTQMGMLIFVVAFYFSILGYDMFHDLGLYIGMKLFS